MKKTVLIIFLCISGLRGKSQAYIPMLNSTAEWHITTCYFGCITSKYYLNGDTVISGVKFKFLDNYHYMKNFVIREDTTERKIYMRFLGDTKPTDDYLLYDFKLNVNDTMDVINPSSPLPKGAGKFVLDSIVSKPLVNKNYRHFYLRSLDTTASNVKNTIWVEGIGSLCLINTPGGPPNITGIGEVTCFFNNGILEYEKLDSITACQAIGPISVREELIFKNSISIHPNPSSNLITIKAGAYDFEGQSIEVMNMLGKTEFVVDYNNSINISSLSSGLYFLRFIKSNQSYVLKFVKE